MEYPFPSFKAPPLDEVSIGLQFQRLDRLRIPHIGAFWERLRSDFPVVDHAPPIMANAPDSVPWLLPRVWFIDKSDTRLLQIQDDRINFNWRSRQDATVYPRYHSISSKFFEIRDSFEKFLSIEEVGVIQPTVTELTYINIFEQGRDWETVQSLGNIFRDFPWSSEAERFMPPPKNISWTLSFALPDNQGTLNVRVNQGVRVQDNHKITQMELVATCPVLGWSREAIDKWYLLAHEWIVKGFADLTKPEAQKNHWGREA